MTVTTEHRNAPTSSVPASACHTASGTYTIAASSSSRTNKQHVLSRCNWMLSAVMLTPTASTLRKLISRRTGLSGCYDDAFCAPSLSEPTAASFIPGSNEHSVANRCVLHQWSVPSCEGTLSGTALCWLLGSASSPGRPRDASPLATADCYFVGEDTAPAWLQIPLTCGPSYCHRACELLAPPLLTA